MASIYDGPGDWSVYRPHQEERRWTLRHTRQHPAPDTRLVIVETFHDSMEAAQRAAEDQGATAATNVFAHPDPEMRFWSHEPMRKESAAVRQREPDEGMETAPWSSWHSVNERVVEPTRVVTWHRQTDQDHLTLGSALAWAYRACPSAVMLRLAGSEDFYWLGTGPVPDEPGIVPFPPRR